MTQPNCPLHQPRCGLQEGNPICPKCGLDVRVRFVSEDTGLLAKSQAEAKYWESETEEAKLQADMQARRNPGQVFQDHPDAPQMVALPTGTFFMGAKSTGWLDKVFGLSETPQHKVTIAYKLAMGRYPVTFEEWDSYVANLGTSSYRPSDQGWGRNKRPVINVSWEEAQIYIAWLNQKLGISADDPYRYRLPSEAEWEYACRAGSQTKWCCGDDENQLNEYAWLSDKASISGALTHPVGGKKANAFGLYDMHGNVWEWVQDLAHYDYKNAPTNGKAWEIGVDDHHLQRVLRGGGVASEARSSSRFYLSQGLSRITHGFRLARTLP